MLALVVTALVAAALLSDTLVPRLVGTWSRWRARRRMTPGIVFSDPGRERRAEQRARELLRSCISDEEWAMYRELGFLRVWGGASRADDEGGPEYAYLIYAHRPIISYSVQTGRLLHEYCVAFPDQAAASESSRLPDSDDVLAKWMALTGDEQRLLDNSNMHLPGRQLDVATVTRDLWRLGRWERARMRELASELDPAPHRTEH
jgi:hypothetical protein